MAKKRKRGIVYAIAGVLFILLTAAGAGWIYGQNCVYENRTFEAGEEILPEDFLKNPGRKISFADNSGTIHNTVPGEYAVQLKAGIFTYDCTAVVLDTIAPTAEAVQVYVDEGVEVTPEMFVTNIADVTETKISFVTEPDISAYGVQNVQIALTDAGNNCTVIESQMIVRVTVEELLLEAGEPFPEIEEFLKKQEQEASFVTDISSVSTNEVGEYNIDILANEIVYTTRLKIQDTIAPVVEVEDIVIYDDESVAPEDFIVSATDETSLTISFAEEPDMSGDGAQIVTILVTDQAGNITRKEAQLTVLHDTESPVITGVRDVTVYVGNSIGYTTGITVSDNHDSNVQLQVDSSAVNIQAIGSYPVTYTATDAAGNQTQASATVQVVPYPYEIHVNRQANTVTVYVPDENGNHTIPYTAFVCSCGSDTPEGTFRTSDKYTWRALIHNVYGQYATRITGSILFHSVPYTAMSKGTLQAEEYNKLGQTASAGCIRLPVANAKWIYDNCPSGTTVVIYSSDDPGPLGKPAAQQIPLDSTWDPTDPAPENPWNSQQPDSQ
jgi:lipoprotein-anchoring transpeptidase ErfK/SrfK